MRPVFGFGTDEVHVNFGEVRCVPLLEHSSSTLEHGLQRLASLALRVNSANGHPAHQPIPVEVGRGHLERVGRLRSPGPGDLDLLVSDLRHLHPGKIADHVGEYVRLGIADLVHHLFRDAGRTDDAAGSFGFADDEATVVAHFHDGVPDVRPVFRELPVREQSACRLRAAFDNVSRQARASEGIVIFRLPAEFVNARAHGDRAVHTAPGDHDVRAPCQGRSDGERAEIGVHAHELRGQRRPAEHLGDACSAEPLDPVHQVVSRYHGHLQVEAELLDQALDGPTAGFGIDPTAVRDDLDSLRRDLRKGIPHHLRDEIVGVAEIGVLRPLPGHDGHRDLRQVVEHQIVQLLRSQELWCRHVRVAPETRGASDLDRLHGSDLVGLNHLVEPLRW